METHFNADRYRNETKVTRVFKSSRDRLWQAYTDPGFIPLWWGPAGVTTQIIKQEFHSGGAWQFLQKDSSGNQYAFHGSYKEIIPTERLVSTLGPGMSGTDDRTETAIFKDWPNHMTRLTLITRYETTASLDIALASNLEQGTKEALDRLVRLVEGS